MESNTILEVKDLKVYFPVKSGVLRRTSGYIKAVDGVSFRVMRGETLGLVGESGCGKTTIGRSIVRLNEPAGGNIFFENQDIFDKKGKDLRDLRKKVQIIFQDPYSSLNPRKTIKRLLGEVLTIQMGLSKEASLKKTSSLLQQVGLSPVYAERYPHEFSGGQRQRVAIAKAIALNPKFLVCDEAVSALDVSIQSQIINLLMDLKKEYKDITYLFISHALNVVEHISDRVAVMYLGKFVEIAKTEDLFNNPLHPYTKALLSAVPLISEEKRGERILLKGEIPGAGNIPKGCRFHTRCPYVTDICRKEEPELKQRKESGHFSACHFN